MRTRGTGSLIVVMTLAAGCEQLSGLGLSGGGAQGSDDAVPPSIEQVHWTTPHDGVELVAAGAVTLVPDDDDPIEALHLRVVVAPRELRTTAQLTTAQLEPTGHGAIRAFAANASLASLPSVIAEPGSRHVIDLYFPRLVVAGESLSRVVFAWQVATANGPRDLRATVDASARAAEGLALGTSPRWWFDPAYRWPELRHRDGVITPRPPRSAAIRRAAPRDDARDVTTECDEW